jgi:hypothetical protein
VEYQGGSETVAFASISEKIAANTEAVLKEAQRTRRPPREIALEIARERITRMASFRRWHA